MTLPILALREALATELQTISGTVFQRKYAAYSDQTLDEPQWVIFPAKEKLPKEMRHLVQARLTIGLGLQQSLPEREEEDDEFIDNIAWLDERLELIESVIKAPFRPGGPLRNKRIAECEFREMDNDPLYRPDLLLEHSLFTSVVTLEFEYEYEE